MPEPQTAQLTRIVSVPEPGQLVEVRRRQWVVADIVASESHIAGHSPQHLVTLSSIDEDGLGEELQVVWEIEPGAHIIEKAGLPEITGFDHADKLDAFLDAVRWGCSNQRRSRFPASTISQWRIDRRLPARSPGQSHQHGSSEPPDRRRRGPG